MIPIGIAIFFVLFSVVVWLMISPESRMQCMEMFQQTVLKLNQWKQRLIRTHGRFANVKKTPSLYFSWHAHQKLIVLTVIILLTPVFVALIFHTQLELEGFTEEPQNQGTLIAALLQGEQLVPPPPLPPELFLANEVQVERPMIESASRDWSLLDPDFRQRLLATYKIMEQQHGYKMVLLEGYRTPERQNNLALLGNNITNARAYQSYHQYGLAADSAFLRDGKVVISERDPWAMKGYELYGQVAESAGLTWGGRWKLMDFGHIELHRQDTLGKTPPK